MFNSAKLYQEITQAGVSIDGCNSNGRVDYKPETTPAQIDLVERPIDGIKALHNPNTLLPVDQVQADADGQAANIPNWSVWTMAQWQTWWDNNLGDAMVDAIPGIPLEARTMLKRQNLAILNLGKMEIALRNKTWPQLQSP
jgi:hypothetical protein